MHRHSRVSLLNLYTYATCIALSSALRLGEEDAHIQHIFSTQAQDSSSDPDVGSVCSRVVPGSQSSGEDKCTCIGESKLLGKDDVCNVIGDFAQVALKGHGCYCQGGYGMAEAAYEIMGYTRAEYTTIPEGEGDCPDLAQMATRGDCERAAVWFNLSFAIVNKTMFRYGCTLDRKERKKEIAWNTFPFFHGPTGAGQQRICWAGMYYYEPQPCPRDRQVLTIWECKVALSLLTQDRISEHQREQIRSKTFEGCLSIGNHAVLLSPTGWQRSSYVEETEEIDAKEKQKLYICRSVTDKDIANASHTWVMSLSASAPPKRGLKAPLSKEHNDWFHQAAGAARLLEAAGLEGSQNLKDLLAIMEFRDNYSMPIAAAALGHLLQGKPRDGTKLTESAQEQVVAAWQAVEVVTQKLDFVSLYDKGGILTLMKLTIEQAYGNRYWDVGVTLLCGAALTLFLKSVIESVDIHTRNWHHRRCEGKLHPDKVHEVVEKAQAEASEELLARSCDFYFVDADYFRSLADNSDNLESLPDYHTLKKSGRLRKKRFSFAVSVATETFRKEYLVISHPWASREHPDPEMTQMKAIIEYVVDNPAIQYVWYDYFSMPQGERSDVESAYFSVALRQINGLYLGCHVLIMLNLAYQHRFWCLLESFLAMHECSPQGLISARPLGKRYTILPIDAAQKAGGKYSKALEQSWATIDVDTAFKILRNPDVNVTCLKDKEEQLDKLQTLEEEVRKIFGHLQ